MGTRARVVLIVVALGAPGAFAGEDREQAAAEARGQAAEADRLYKLGEYAAALPLYEAERASRAALGETQDEAYAQRGVGCCLAHLGDDDAAIRAWHVARGLDARRDDPGFVGYDWFLIGQAHLRRDRLDESLAALNQALPRLSTAVDRDHEADARLTIAATLSRLERPKEALVHLDRSESLARDLNDPKRLAPALLASSIAARSSGAFGIAAERADEAARVFTSFGARHEAALASRALGEALAELDRLDAASARLDDAAREHAALADFPALADDLTLLAAVRADDGAPADAVDIARRALSARREAGDSPGEVDALVSLASYEDQAGDRVAAAATLGDALTIARRESNPAHLVRLLVLSSSVTRRAGDAAKANALLNEAGQMAATVDNAALKRMVTDAKASGGNHNP